MLIINCYNKNLKLLFSFVQASVRSNEKRLLVINIYCAAN